jgi:hypothetical protein
MNLNESLTREGVGALLSSADDDAAHHVLWVGNDGEVHLDPVPEDLTPAGWERQMDDVIRFRHESFQRGNGYVGDAAAADSSWVEQLYEWLTTNWTEGRRGYQGG